VNSELFFPAGGSTMNAKRIVLLFVAVISISLFVANAGGEEDKQKQLPDFADFFIEPEYTVNPKIEGYSIPLQRGKIADCPALELFDISKNDQSLLANGFVIYEGSTTADVANFYKNLREKKIPLLITADVLLHIQHVLYLKALTDIEENFLRTELSELLWSLLYFASQTPERNDPSLNEAYALLKAYAEVGLWLLNGNFAPSDERVPHEIWQIFNVTEFKESPIFTYKVDYSQFIPRGHYNKSGKLQTYFRALMWISTMKFFAIGSNERTDLCAVDVQTAKLQSCAALLMADFLASVRDRYDRFLAVTTLFAGESDDLTPANYREISKSVFDGKVWEIFDDAKYHRFVEAISKLPAPQIYNGLGDVTIVENVGNKAGRPEKHDDALRQSRGLCLFGRRISIDSMILGRLVYPDVGHYDGTGVPFTGNPEDPRYRLLPSSLDVMSVLGSDAASEILKEYQYSAYRNYFEMNRLLAAKISSMPMRKWAGSLNTATLFSIRTLLAKPEKGIQPFQRTSAWERRKLNAALGAWTALKHDVKLYEKQSSYTFLTAPATIIPSPKPTPTPAVGYVEPEPRLYARMIAANNMLTEGIRKISPIGNRDFNVETSFGGMLNFCLSASIKELQCEELGGDENAVLAQIGQGFFNMMGNDESEYSTVIVSDLHTDANKGYVLHTATGPMRPILVAWARPDGFIELAVGLVYSWEEFKLPDFKRLSDEDWHQMVKQGTRVPPVWMQPFMAK
jgi:hypothetical protein